MKLKNKVAVVTGASHGLGKALTKILAKEKVTVFALARSIKERKLPTSVKKIPCDISDLKNIDQAFSEIDNKTKKIDFLINCAGRGLVKPLEKTSQEEIKDVLGVNLMGNIYVAQEVYKRMIPKKRGHILNVGSTSSLKPRDYETIYAASKWGLRGFTESLRLAAKAHNIRVTGIYPGGMKSKKFWEVNPANDISGYMPPQDVANHILNLLKSPISTNPSEVVIERF